MTTGLVHIHWLMAVLTIAVFVVQGVLALAAPGLVRHKAVRIGSHVIYTLLLVSAITLLVAYGWNPLDFTWIMLKILLLVLFIVFGIVAFRPGFAAPLRGAAWVAGAGCLLWAYSIAQAKAPIPFA